MDAASQDYYLQWVISDYTPFVFNEREYFLSYPTREARFQAERIYMMILKESQDAGLYSDNDIFILLKKHSLWDETKEDLLNKLFKDIEEIKVNIFNNYTNSLKRKDYKRALKDTMDLIGKMLSQKQSFDNYSSKNIALFAKQHFIMGSSIYRKKNKPLFSRFWNCKDDDIIHHCYEIMSEYILNDADYRLLARSPNWRNLWASRKSIGSLFGKPAVDLSLPQRQIVMWSNVYDGVYKSSDCPVDTIIEDDDALDGWMIVQKRNRDKQNNKSIIEESLQNEKIRNSDHIYIMCDEADAQKVYDCNDFEGRIRLNRIMKQVEKEGCVGFMGLKDTQSEIYRKSAEIRR